MSACGDHHWVEDHVSDVVFLDEAGYEMHYISRLQHSNLDGFGTYVVEDSPDLSLHYVGRDRMDCCNADGILHCNSRNSACGVASEGGDSFDVGLYSGTSRAVASCYGQYCIVMFHKLLCWENDMESTIEHLQCVKTKKGHDWNIMTLIILLFAFLLEKSPTQSLRQY